MTGPRERWLIVIDTCVEGEAELMDMLRECDRTRCKRWRLCP